VVEDGATDLTSSVLRRSKVREEQDFARYEKGADFAYGFCSMFLEFKNFFG